MRIRMTAAEREFRMIRRLADRAGIDDVAATPDRVLERSGFGRRAMDLVRRSRGRQVRVELGDDAALSARLRAMLAAAEF